MFKLKTLRRLTRFAMSFYVFSYCMSFTVCAEEYPFHDASANEISYYANNSSTDEAAENVTEEEVVPETETLEAATPDPGIEEVYNGSSFSGLFNQIWDNVRGVNESENYDKSYSVVLTDDIALDNGSVANYVNRIGDVTIDANGHSFTGAGTGFAGGRSDLNDFHAFRYLTIKNARFTGFESGVFVHDWVDLGWRYNNLILENCTFEGNEGGSGAIVCAVQQDYISLVNCTFKNNKASRNGGIVYLTYPGSFSAEGCSFINNTADGNGGAIAVLNQSRSVEIRDCSFINNTAGGNGGAVYVADESSDVQIRDCYFGNNKASKGGAVYDEVTAGSKDGNSYYVTGCEFMSNIANAANGGGAIYRENTAVESDKIMNGVFLGNTDPQIVLANVDNRTNIGNVIDYNWYGGTVDDAMAGGNAGRPSISIGGEGTTGVYNWKLLNMERQGTFNVSYITFSTYAAAYGYSNGSVVYDKPNSGEPYYVHNGIPLGIRGENITFEKNTVDFAADGYSHKVNATVKSGARTYSVTLTDPFGNELITRNYDRNLDEWGVTTYVTSARNGSTAWTGTALEGDTIICRLFTNMYVTSDNGTLMRYIGNNGYVYGSTVTGPYLYNESIRVYADEKLLGNYTTDSEGLIIFETDAFGKFGTVNLAFENDIFSERYETTLNIIADGETEVSSYPAGDNAVEVYLSSESGKPLNEGVLSLYYSTQSNASLTLFDSWDMSVEGEANKTRFSKVITGLNETLPAGYYYFKAAYTCESGNLKNASEVTYSGSSKGTLVGSEGYTAVDLQTGSSKNTLEVHMTSIGNTNENCTVSLFYRPVAGGSDTLLKSWNMGNESEYYRSNFWGEANASALPEGDYVFTVNFNCTDGTFVNSTVSKTFTVPIISDYDADVSIPFGANMTVKLGSQDFNLNAVAANPGTNGKWIYKSSNTSVATISDEGLIHPVSIGQTNITAIYKANPYKSGSAVLLLTVTEASSGNGSTPINGTTPVNGTTPDNGTAENETPTNASTSSNEAPENVTIENKTEVVMVEVQPIVVPDQNISVAMTYTESVPFTGSKFKASQVVDEGNGVYTVANVSVKVNSTVLSFAKPVFKFKNVKHSTAKSGKKAKFVVTFKANKNATKEQKKQIRALNKLMKKQAMEFTLEQVDISNAVLVRYWANKKITKLKKVNLTVDSVLFKLKNKRDYTAEITDEKITLTGKGDYKNTYVIPLNNE